MATSSSDSAALVPAVTCTTGIFRIKFFTKNTTGKSLLLKNVFISIGGQNSGPFDYYYDICRDQLNSQIRLTCENKNDITIQFQNSHLIGGMAVYFEDRNGSKDEVLVINSAFNDTRNDVQCIVRKNGQSQTIDVDESSLKIGTFFNEILKTYNIGDNSSTTIVIGNRQTVTFNLGRILDTMQIDVLLSNEVEIIGAKSDTIPPPN